MLKKKIPILFHRIYYPLPIKSGYLFENYYRPPDEKQQGVASNNGKKQQPYLP